MTATESKPLNSNGQSFSMSFFKCNIRTMNAKPVKTYSVKELLTEGIGKDFKNLLEPIKRLEYQTPEYKQAKAKLHYFTPAGTFKIRNNKGLIKLSGLMLNDYDLQSNTSIDTDLIIKKLTSDPYVLGLFCSPSGGIKFFIKATIPDNGYTKYYQYYGQQVEYFEQKYGIRLDKSQGKLSQPCFVSYDPKYYYNPESKSFTFLKIGIEKSIIKKYGKCGQNHSPNNRFETKFEFAEYLTQKAGKSFVVGQRHHYVCILGLMLNRLGISENEAESYARNTHPHYAQNPSNAIESAYQNTQDYDTLPFIPYSEFIKKQQAEKATKEPIPSLFTAKTLNETIQEGLNAEPIKHLFGEFLNTGELCMLFADNGTGKSLLSLQIADHVGNGKNLMGFKNECEPMKVLFFDFELSSRNLAKRYPEKRFSDNIIRLDISAHNIVQAKDWQNALLANIKAQIQQNNAGLAIIDNLSAISDGDMDKSNVATKLLNSLNTIKRELNVTILVISHPNKELKEGMPISKNQLSGSKQLTNLVDSCFAIGKNVNNDAERYLKQLKVRNTDLVYGAKNVVHLRIDKSNGDLKFEFLGFTREELMIKDSFRVEKIQAKDQLIKTIKEMYYQQKMTQTEIATTLNLTQSKVSRYLNKLHK